MEGVLEGQDMSREPLGLWGRAPTHCALTGMTRAIGSSLFLHSFCLKHLLIALPVPLWSKPLLGALEWAFHGGELGMGFCVSWVQCVTR